MQKIAIYIESLRRMTRRQRPNPELAQGVKDLCFLTPIVAVFMVYALYHHDNIYWLYWLGAVLTTSVVLWGWTHVVREIIKELNAIANLIGDRK
ncbi:hypothetical protein [Paraburkholderia sp. GAS42]|uniref:hypothetical protein n=1 Tax=Paraburkholderia sp. GAS42 TaxID=3035135 RepID=UPI003D1DEBA8